MGKRRFYVSCDGYMGTPSLVDRRNPKEPVPFGNRTHARICAKALNDFYSDKCRDCDGTGDQRASEDPCPTCNGTGKRGE